MSTKKTTLSTLKTSKKSPTGDSFTTEVEELVEEEKMETSVDRPGQKKPISEDFLRAQISHEMLRFIGIAVCVYILLCIPFMMCKTIKEAQQPPVEKQKMQAPNSTEDSRIDKEVSGAKNGTSSGTPGRKCW